MPYPALEESNRQSIGRESARRQGEGSRRASRVRSGDGDDKPQPARRLQSRLRELRWPDQPKPWGLRRRVGATDTPRETDNSHGGRRPLQTPRQKIITGG